MGSRRRVIEADEYEGLLNRRLSAVLVQEQMRGAHGLLFEEVKWGLGLYERLDRTGPRESRVFDSSIRLFWLYLEALDATDCLISAGAIGPARVQARTLLDMGLQLLYVLQRNDELVAAAYTTHRRRQHLREALRYRTGAQTRKEVEAEAKRTTNLPEDFVQRIPDSTAEAERLQRSLEGPLWRAASEELERLGDPDRWYRAFGGPANLKELARTVGMELVHRILYAPWSGFAHGNQTNRMEMPGDDGFYIRPMRDGEGWEHLLEITTALTLRVFSSLIQRFRDGEQQALARWHDQILRPRLEDSPLGRSAR
jgi:hypothetical protein